MSAVNKLQKVLNGELDFYFSFESIQLFKGDTLLTVLNENNCDNSRAVFKRGGLYGGVFAAFDVMDDDTPETLQKRIMEEAEWKILPAAVKLFCEERITVKENRVYLKGE